ncbi:MAG: YceI family protein [Alphaproteobacteria bacterium]|nr:YceI family protein [Alphaproteobacteria bacterium]
MSIALLRHPAALVLLPLLAACDGGTEPASTTTPPPGPPAAGDQQPPDASGPQKTTELQVQSATIDMITVKNGDVEVPAKFTGVTGSVRVDLDDPKGTSGELTIDLASWDSGLELRDDRIKETFFEVAAHPTTTFAIKSMETTDTLAEVGKTASGKLRGTLTWREATVELIAPVSIERTGDSELHLKSTEPFVVDMQALGMDAQKQALITLCQHDSLLDAVTVSVDMVVGPPAPEPATPSTTETPAAQPPSEGSGPKALPKVEQKAKPGAPATLDPKAGPSAPGTKAVPLNKGGN